MRIALLAVTLLSFVVFGCDGNTANTADNAETPSLTAPAPATDAPVPAPAPLNEPVDTATPPTMPPATPTASNPMPGSAAALTEAPAGFSPVGLENGVAKLSPDNTTIEFVGRHVQPDGSENDPRARTGVFEKFTAQVEFDPATKMLKSAQADIDTTSLWVPQENLRAHLTNPDFLDVRNHPTIKFESTRIEPAAEPGKLNITGNLTLHGTTKSITIPATVTYNDEGVTIDSEFTIDRTDYGMDRLLERVIPKVDLRVMVGKKTERP
jgi:polyisoprenoid-binding protein YceI